MSVVKSAGHIGRPLSRKKRVEIQVAVSVPDWSFGKPCGL
jgi:hypothetical protein